MTSKQTILERRVLYRINSARKKFRFQNVSTRVTRVVAMTTPRLAFCQDDSDSQNSELVLFMRRLGRRNAECAWV